MTRIAIYNLRPTYLKTCTGLRLMPGSEPVFLDAETYAVLKDDPTFRSWRKMEYVKVTKSRDHENVEELVEGGSILEDMPQAEAKRLILSCENIDTLLQWHVREKRPAFKKMIEQRMSDLEAMWDEAKGDASIEGDE